MDTHDAVTSSARYFKDISVCASQALNTIPRKRAEWFIWLDMDMVLENVTFDLPLETYEGRDIIMWGQPEWIAKGDNARGCHLHTCCHVCWLSSCP